MKAVFLVRVKFLPHHHDPRCLQGTFLKRTTIFGVEPCYMKKRRSDPVASTRHFTLCSSPTRLL